jgi:hypothetical protein
MTEISACELNDKEDELKDQAVNRARFGTIKTVENDKNHIIASVVQTQRRVCRATSIVHMESAHGGWNSELGSGSKILKFLK